MRMIDSMVSSLVRLDPLDWWIMGFVVAGLAVAVLSGFFRARKIQRPGFKWKIFGHEILWSVVNVSVSAFTLGTLKSFLVGRGLIVYNAAPVSGWVVLLEYAAYFVVFDTWFYWGHRLMHVEPFYKWTHKTHHVSTKTNPLTALSVNPVEAFVNGAIVPLFLAVVTLLASLTHAVAPIHTTTIALIAPTSILMGFYVHSGFEFLPRWWNRTWATKWFISASFHDQHHRFFLGNYGGYTTIWDRLCGTMRKNFETDFAKTTSRPIDGFRLLRGGEQAGA